MPLDPEFSPCTGSFGNPRKWEVSTDRLPPYYHLSMPIRSTETMTEDELVVAIAKLIDVNVTQVKDGDLDPILDIIKFYRRLGAHRLEKSQAEEGVKVYEV